MLRILSRFNALFIRAAILEYQTELSKRVKDDIEALHEKFKVFLTNVFKKTMLVKAFLHCRCNIRLALLTE